MKKSHVFCIVFLFFSWSSFGQLTGINPDTAVYGSQTLITTITGNGIFIQSSTSAGNIFSVKLFQGQDSITIYQHEYGWPYGWMVNVINTNTVTVEFNLPITAMHGVYDLQVVTGDIYEPTLNQLTYNLPGSYYILPPDGYITGTVYEDLNKNGINDVGEPGIPGRMVKLQPNNYNSYTNSNGNYRYGLDNGNYSIVNFNMQNDYRFLTSSNDTLSMVINNNNSAGNDFGWKTALVSVTPDTGFQGITTTHTLIAEEPIFIVGPTQSGNITNILVKTSPMNYAFGSSIMVFDSVTAQFSVTVQSNTNIGGNIDIDVHINPGIGGVHKLKRQFNIATAPSFITGTVYHDLNKDGIKDIGEPGIAGRTVRLISGGITAVTDVNGNYSLPSLNGNFSATVDSVLTDWMFITSGDTISGTVNNNTSSGNDFGLKRAVVSVTPNFAYKGLTTTHQIVVDEPIFGPASFPYMNIYTSPTTWISSTNNTIIDSVTIQVNATIPSNAVIADSLDIAVRVGPGWVKSHYLKQQFSIVPAPNTVEGALFIDQNQNKQKDPGEPGVNGSKAILSPDSSFGFPDIAGNFLVGSFGGIQTLTYENTNNNVQLFTDSVSYTFNATGSVNGKDFGFISTLPDYTVDIQSTYMRPRCNTNQYAYLFFYNLGTIMSDMVAWIKHDSLMTYVSSPTPPSNVSGDTLFWNYTGVAPFALTGLHAWFSIPGPGDTVEVTYGVHSIDGTGAIQFAESTTVLYPVVCSFDPNDKQVTPPGILAQNYTLMSDTLDYLIRFQNTGNDTAYNVVVLDTLDSNLDLNTFEIIGSSHSMQTEVESNGATRFEFNDIMLPDSNVNEPESHGFIQYRILAKAGLPDDTPVNNTAHIFFDFNADVVTNTTLNTLVYVLPTGISESTNADNGVRIYPNPFNNSATLYFENPGSEMFELSISNLTGNQVVPLQSTTGNSFTIQRNRLANGIYFYKLQQTQTGFSRYGKFVVE